MLLSSFFARSMAFTHTPKVQLPFALFSETFLTIRQNSLYVTVCIIARPSYRGYFIHSLSTLHYCNAPSLATRLTGDYRDRTCTSKRGPALLDTTSNVGSYPLQQHHLFTLIKVFNNFTNSFRNALPDIRQVFFAINCLHECNQLIPDTFAVQLIKIPFILR